jgi:hypothetical protein
MQPSRSLLAFSVIAESFSSTGDILQGLIPLFEPIAIDFAGKRFDGASFATELKKRYDFEIPLAVAEDWAKRLEAAGYLENVSTINGIVDYRYKTVERSDNNLSTDQIDKILDEFNIFVLNNPADVIFTEEVDIAQEFYNRLIRIESLVRLHGEESAKEKSRISPESTTLTLANKQNIDVSPEDNNVSFHLDYLFASFIENLSERNDGSLQLLAQISGGAMLAEVVLSFQEPPKRGDSLSEVDFYLDAPIVMDLLGLDKKRERYAKELFETLKNEKANLWIFDHGIDEIDRAIHARMSDHQNGWQPHISAPERLLLTRIKGRVASVLDSLGIKVMRFQGDAYERSLAYFSQEQEDLLFSALSFHANEAARSADAKSLANIERLRRNRRIPIGAPLLRAGPVLVTRNTALATAARRFMERQTTSSKGDSTHNIEADICILDGYLAGLLWITVGGSANQLPYSQLVANCATAVAPKRGVITKAIKLLSSINQEQAIAFEAIMHDERAEHYLMNLTLSDSSLVTNENITEIYEKIKQSVGHETEMRLTAEFNKRLEEQNDEHASAIEKLQKERDKDAMAVSSQFAELRSEFQNTQAQIILQNAANKQLKDTISALQQNIDSEIAHKESVLLNSLELANRIGKIIPIALSLILALVFFFSQDFLAGLEGYWKPFAQSVLGILTVLSFVVAFWDNPEILFGKFRKKIIQKCYWVIVDLRGLKKFALTRQVNWTNSTIQK